MGYLTEALLRGLIQESRDWDWCQYALGERGGPFLGQALISICSLLSPLFACLGGFPNLFVQCRLPNRLALRASFVPVLVPPL